MGITLPNEIKFKKFFDVEQDTELEIENALGIIGLQVKINDDDTTIVDNFSVNTNWVEQDLKYMITKFVVDTESVSGHFTDGTNRISIKNVGTDNPYVKENVVVAFLDGETTRYLTINTITNNGDQDDEVTFRESEGTTLEVGTYDVEHIYGALVYDYETDTGVYNLYQDPNDREELTLNLDTTSIVPMGEDTFRIAVPTETFDGISKTIQISVKTTADEYIFNKVSIGERLMTLDDWSSAFEGTAVAPRRVVIQYDLLRLGLELTGGGDIDNACVVNQSVSSLTPADVYHFSMIAKAETSGNKIILAFSYEDTDEYWYNFTGVNAGTYTISPKPTADQQLEVTLTDEYAPYTPALAQIPVPATGEINTWLIAFDEKIRVAEVSMKKDGTGTNILKNNTLDQWTGTSNCVGIPTPLVFDGIKTFGDDFISDSLIYTLDYGYDYLIVIDTKTSDKFMSYGTNVGYTTYFKAGTQSYNQKDLDTPDNTFADTIYGVSRILINYGKVSANNYYTAHNTINASTEATLDYSIDSIIKNITTGSNAFISFSFDGGDTYKVFDKASNVFHTIASNKNSETGLTEGVWCYKTYSTGLWTAMQTAFNDKNTAISKALEVSSQYRYNINDISLIKFTEPNGFKQGDTFSFAYTLFSSDEYGVNDLFITNYSRYDTIRYANVTVDNNFEVYSLNFDSGYQRKSIYLKWHDHEPISETLPILYVYYF